MSLNSQELLAIRDRTLELRCRSVHLTQCGSAEPQVVRGPGLVRMTPDGELTLTMFVQEARELPPGSDRAFQPTPLGEFIPETEYYSLEAVDERGALWRCGRTYVSAPLGLPGVGKFVNAELPWLTRVIDHRERRYAASHAENVIQRRQVRLRYFDEFRYPANLSTVVELARGEERRYNGRRDAAHVTMPGLRVSIGRDERITTLRATTEDDLPPGLATHLSDALEFILGRPLWADVEEVQSHGVEEITIRPPRGSDAHITPPVPTNIVHGEDNAWELFSLYLARLLAEPSSDRHPIAGVWRGVLAAGGRSIETEALVWSVAVESLLPLTNPDPPRTDEYDPLVEWREIALAALQSAGCPVTAIARIGGVLARLDQPPAPGSAASKLRALVGQGVISQRHLSAWQRVRHRSAHGALDVANDPQQVIRDTSAVLGLLYVLVLRAVGYAGSYHDLSEGGWPVRQLGGGQSSDVLAADPPRGR